MQQIKETMNRNIKDSACENKLQQVSKGFSITQFSTNNQRGKTDAFVEEDNAKTHSVHINCTSILFCHLDF